MACEKCSARHAAAAAAAAEPPAPAAPAPAFVLDPQLRRFTPCDLARLAAAGGDSIWLTAHGLVYQIPLEWIERAHPGGAGSILRHAGKDCSTDFDFHSPRAQAKVWKSFCAGKLAPCTAAPPSGCGIA